MSSSSNNSSSNKKDTAFLKFGKQLSGIKDKKNYIVPTKFCGPELKSVKIARSLLKEFKIFCADEELNMKDVLAHAINVHIMEDKMSAPLLQKTRLLFNPKEHTNTNLNAALVLQLKKTASRTEDSTMYELVNYAVYKFLGKQGFYGV